MKLCSFVIKAPIAMQNYCSSLWFPCVSAVSYGCSPLMREASPYPHQMARQCSAVSIGPWTWMNGTSALIHPETPHLEVGHFQHPNVVARKPVWLQDHWREDWRWEETSPEAQTCGWGRQACCPVTKDASYKGQRLCSVCCTRRGGILGSWWCRRQRGRRPGQPISCGVLIPGVMAQQGPEDPARSY